MACLSRAFRKFFAASTGKFTGAGRKKRGRARGFDKISRNDLTTVAECDIIQKEFQECSRAAAHGLGLGCRC